MLYGLRRTPLRAGPLVVFLWSTALGPALHLVDHQDDHVHEAGATRYLALHEHDHDHDHEHIEVHDHDGPAAPRNHDGAPSPPHGASSSDHFATTLVETASTPAPRRQDGLITTLPDLPPPAVPSPRPRRRHLPRGPPRSASV
jgi:hypothetical protein